MKSKKPILRKLNSRRGFSLSELLVTITILALVTSAVATGVSSSIRTYRKSVMLSESQTLTSSLVTALEDELRYASHPQADAEGILTSYTSSRYGRVSLEITNGKVYCSGNPLLPDGAYSELSVQVPSGSSFVTFDGSHYTVNLSIIGDGNSLDTLENFIISPLLS